MLEEIEPSRFGKRGGGGGPRFPGIKKPKEMDMTELLDSRAWPKSQSYCVAEFVLKFGSLRLRVDSLFCKTGR